MLEKEIITKSKNSRLKCEEKFLSSIKSFIKINQFFCTAPINIKFLSWDSKTSDKKMRIYQILHLIWGITIGLSVCIATYRQHEEFDETSLGFMTKILYIGEYTIGTCNLVLILSTCQYQRKQYPYYFKRLIEVDLNLEKCGIRPNYESTRKYLRNSMIFYFVFFIWVILTDFFYNKMIFPSFLRSSTVYTIPNIIGVLSLTQYSLVLHFIRDKLRTINGILKRLVRHKDLKSSFLVNNKINIISVIFMDWEKREFGLDRIIEILRKQHSNLSRLVEQVNKSFGILILSTIIAAYIILSIQFYAFYKMSEGYTEQDIYLTIYTILWIILHGGKIILILYPINDVTDAVTISNGYQLVFNVLKFTAK
jgi:hypothetical protein